MAFSFTKWQGCGNDFVLVDGFAQPLGDYAEVARKACDRHYGIGADGLILLLPSEAADIRMRIFNADGSEAEMCGNGIRCFAREAYASGRVHRKEFSVETGAGILVPKLVDGDGGEPLVRVDMGEPILEGDRIPVKGYGQGRVVDAPIEVLGKPYRMTCVSMGNPHCVVFVDDLRKIPMHEVGPHFESHEAFPRKTNTEFVEVRDRAHLSMRVWERGAAVTLACGTGACASLVAAVLNGKAEEKAEVQLDGGKLLIEWAGRKHVFMTGAAEKVFHGEYDG